MDYLLDRMHSGISAACAGNDTFSLRKFSQRCLQLILHGMARGLRLPSMPVRTIVLDTEY